MQAKVAIVLLNWNGQQFLETYLPVVLASTYANKEVIVIDNASTDDSVDFLHKNYPEIRIIQLTKNWGFAGGYNEGLKNVSATYYILLNTDVAVAPGWIEPMVEMLEKNASIAACQPKLLQVAKPTHFEYAGAAGGWIDHWGYPFARGRVMEDCEEDQGQYDQASPIFWASGAALFIRADYFKEAGGFDTYFFAHQEEIDLCWRLQLLGYQIYACPSSVVYHVGGGTLPKGNPKKVYLNFRNNWIMLAKNMPAGRAIFTLCIRWVLDCIAALKGLLAGDITYGKAILQAQGGFIRWFLKERAQSVFVVKKNFNWDGYYKGSVIVQYFLKGRKKFSEIICQKK